ncbi:MAG: class I SAM-dependent methyltransferase [Sulfuritalea sp.]|nr:class I SAM-dependent methyltransferase [Sulfuritalea sp.]
MSKDYFEHKAGSYEQNTSRVDNVENIANSILGAIKLDKSMHVMDFGSGTGLLLERVAPHVGKITAVDISKSMNRELDGKRNRLGCDIEIAEVDLAKSDIDGKFDGIISSMTMHHIENIEAMLRKFHSMLNEGGFIALSDLDTEDGSFHTEDTGVFHFGFDRKALSEIASNAGFKNVDVVSASVIPKPHADFPVFLLTGFR